MDFGAALYELKRGKSLTRRGWNGPAQYIELQRPDSHSKMTLPYIYIRTVQGRFVPWLASQTDLLAEDWQKVATGTAGPYTPPTTQARLIGGARADISMGGVA